jgi:CRISPR/Cas system CSM-associated protein Csm4 (group 5 of RAMP superfamily)
VLLQVKLRFQSPIVMDLSQGEEFKGIIHSDTLFSAIFNHWVKFKPFEDRKAINKFIDALILILRHFGSLRHFHSGKIITACQRQLAPASSI